MNKTQPEISLDELAQVLCPCKWPAVRRMLAIVKGEAELTKDEAHPERGRLAWIEKRLPALTQTHLEAFRIAPATWLPEEGSVFKEMLEKRTAGDVRLREHVVRKYAEEEARIALWEPVKKRYQRRSKAFLTQMTAQVAAELQQPGVVVTARNKQDTRETLYPVDIQGAVINIGGGTIVKNGRTWDSVSVLDARKGATTAIDNASLAPNSQQRRATDDEMRTWMLDHQASLKRVGKRHGREVILSSAMEQFEASYKIVRTVWDARTCMGKTRSTAPVTRKNPANKGHHHG